jgi:hypothetical protein
MGKPSPSKLNDACSQTCCRGQEKTMSPAARKKLSAKLKAYWAQKKFGKK